MRVLGLAPAELDEPQVHLLAALVPGRGEADGLPQGEGGLVEVAGELPGGTEVGGQLEVVGVGSLGGPQDFDGLVYLAEAQVEGAQVSGVVGVERLLGGELGEAVEVVAVGVPERVGRLLGPGGAAMVRRTRWSRRKPRHCAGSSANRSPW